MSVENILLVEEEVSLSFGLLFRKLGKRNHKLLKGFTFHLCTSTFHNIQIRMARWHIGMFPVFLRHPERSVVDVNQPYISTSQTKIRNVCLSVISESVARLKPTSAYEEA